MPKSMIFNNSNNSDVREQLRNGITKLADAVKVTLGPTGRVVMFAREFGDPVITKDGVTVAKEVDLPDPFENMGVKMVRQATTKTATSAGDGTTTATIYAQAIFEAGLKHVNAGANPQSIRRGIDKATNALVNRLNAISKPVTDVDEVKQVAICSANQDEAIGGVVAEAIDTVGHNGVVTIEEGTTLETKVKVVDGLQFNQGYMHPQFATEDRTQLCEYEKPAILIIDDKLINVQQFIAVIEKATKLLKGKPLVIIAEEFSDDIITIMVINKVRGGLKSVAIKAPGFGDRRHDSIEDLAIATGATVFGNTTGQDLSKVQLSDFGSCEKIVIGPDNTTIVEGRHDDALLQERITLLQDQLVNTVSDFVKERIQERLARLTGGVAQIVVGGATEAEVREKRDRIDDALHACKAALDEGVLPGGGVALLHLSDIDVITDDEDEALGVQVVRKAVEAPLRQIAINTGVDAGVVVAQIRANDEYNYGYNASTGEYGDMYEMGIVVPTKVERTALQNAASIAGLLLATDCMIAFTQDTKGAESNPGILG